MKRTVMMMIVPAILIMAMTPVSARNVRLFVVIETAMLVQESDEKPQGLVKFYFGEQKPSKVAKSIGSEVVYRKAAAMGKSEETSCAWALQYVLAEFEKRARQFGADAVVNITSLYQAKEFSSATKFECHVGNVVTGVRLRGEYVKLAE